jgi:hypothetical protein
VREFLFAKRGQGVDHRADQPEPPGSALTVWVWGLDWSAYRLTRSLDENQAEKLLLAAIVVIEGSYLGADVPDRRAHQTCGDRLARCGGPIEDRAGSAPHSAACCVTNS